VKRRRTILIIVFLVLIIMVVIFLLPRHPRVREKDMATITIHEPRFAYGINVDTLRIIKGKIKANQNLSGILQSFHVDYSTIDRLTRLAKPVFDVRKIRADNDYTVLCSMDSAAVVMYFIYEVSPVSFVVFDLHDSSGVYMGEKEIRTFIATAQGTIQSSLWNSVLDNGLDPYLAVELSDIYAWTIDFFGIQAGDSYRVIYEREVIEGDTVGVGRILAACFNTMGNDYYAFYYIQDHAGDYFDDKGNSVRRAFLKAPLRYSRISSRYSRSRMHPILKIRRPHFGVDYAAPMGTPVHSIGDGTIIGMGYDVKGGGRYIRIRHNSTYTSLYMHLSGYARGMKQGVRIHQGDLIGYVGKSGLATGPHLDFRIFKNGSPVDPLKVESPPAKPVDAIHRMEYDSLCVDMKRRLDGLQK
jgi:murein DD-endopeptidase MepM/ murein hydrolase activator NlpD